MSGFGPGPLGADSALDITAATVIKASAGALYAISVITAPTSAAAAYDAVAASGNSPADQILAIPSGTAAGTIYQINWHFRSGLVVDPGGGALAASFL